MSCVCVFFYSYARASMMHWALKRLEFYEYLEFIELCDFPQLKMGLKPHV